MKVKKIGSQNIFEIIRTSFILCKHSLVKTIPFSLIYLVASTILVATFFDELSEVDHKFLAQFSFNLLFSGKYLLLASKITLLIMIYLATHATIMYVLNRSYCNENVHFTQAMKVGYKKVFIQLLICILDLVVLVVGPILLILIFICSFPNIITDTFIHFKYLEFAIYLVFILASIPGSVIFIYLMFASYQAIIEEDNIIDSVKNSFNLIVGNWWYMLGAFLIIYAASNTLPYASNFVFSHFSIKDRVYVNFFLKNSLPVIFGTPWIHAFMITILYNLRAKKRASLEVIS